MNILKPRFDKREYHSFILDNEIQVLAISDTDTQTSAISVAINIGSYNDPEEYLGLAHFLEHMLFMGTKKYPDSNYFMSEIAKCGGTTNAYTQEYNTNYHFSVDNENFTEILSIFSSFFIEPLFDINMVDSELHAVDSEHQKNLLNLYALSEDILKIVVSEQHPYHKFMTGNIEELQKDGIRDALLNFYDKYYSSNLIKIAILSNKPISKIIKMVTKYFSKIKNKHIKLPEINTQLFLNKRKIIKVEFPTNHIVLSWEIPLYKGKIFNYISNLLTNEAESSLIYYLKQLFLCELVKIYNPIPTLIMIYISLTDKGLYLIPTIVNYVKEYIKLISQYGVKKWRYMEMRQNNKLWFDNLSIASPLHYVTDIADNMLKVKNIKKILFYDFNYPAYKKKNIKDVLKAMMEEPQIIICSNIYEELSDIHKYYKTRYEISNSFDPKFILIDLGIKFRLPHYNYLIPKHIKIYNNSPKPLKKVIDEDNYKIYYKKDKFNSPIVTMDVFMYNETINKSARNYFLCELFIEIINYQIQSEKYYFDVAGTEFSIYLSNEHIIIHIEGYNQNVNPIIKLLKTQFSNINITKASYDEILNKMIKKTNNVKYANPYMFVLSEVNKNVYYPNYSYDDHLAEINKSTFDDIKNLSNLFYDNYKIDIIVMGNCLVNQAIYYCTFFKSLIKGNKGNIIKLDKLEKGSESVHVYKDINPYNTNSCVAIGYQTNYFNKGPEMTTIDMKEIILTQYINSIISDKFFHQLRTLDKSGYIVATKIINNFTQESHCTFLYFIVQSSNLRPSILRSRINKFIKKMDKEIEDLTPKIFNQHKQSLINSYIPDYQNIYEEVALYESLIINNIDIDIHERYIEICKTINIKEVSEFYKINFIQKQTYKKAIYEYYDNKKLNL